MTQTPPCAHELFHAEQNHQHCCWWQKGRRSWICCFLSSKLTNHSHHLGAGWGWGWGGEEKQSREEGFSALSILCTCAIHFTWVWMVGGGERWGRSLWREGFAAFSIPCIPTIHFTVNHISQSFTHFDSFTSNSSQETHTYCPLLRKLLKSIELWSCSSASINSLLSISSSVWTMFSCVTCSGYCCRHSVRQP